MSELDARSARHWVTATSSPCLSLFKPIEVGAPLDLAVPGLQPDDASLFWAHERLHRTVMRAPDRLAPLFLDERNREQRQMWLEVLREGVDAGVIEAQEHQMVRNVFRLDDRQVGSMMIPRAEMVWIDANATREELRFSSTYRVGQVLEARMDVREIGLTRGEYQVAEVRKDGKVVLERDGKRKVIDPDRINPDHRFDRLGLHEEKQIRLHDGETVFWRDKDAIRDIAKSTYATVLEARPEGIRVELADKRQLVLAPGDPMLRRLDLGYALNAHMAQGMTKPQAIEVISSTQRNLATQRTQNVLNTRATDDMTVVTNNLEGLKQQLDRTPGNKTSALEVTGKVEVEPRHVNPIDTRQVPELRMSPELKAKLDAVLGKVPEAPVKQLRPEKTLGLDL